MSETLEKLKVAISWHMQGNRDYSGDSDNCHYCGVPRNCMHATDCITTLFDKLENQIEKSEIMSECGVSGMVGEEPEHISEGSPYENKYKEIRKMIIDDINRGGSIRQAIKAIRK